MPFTVPNQGSAAFTDQAQVDSVDFDIIVAGDATTGVVSGCAVTSSGTGNGSVSIAAGVVRINSVLYTVAGGTLAIGANSSGNPRYDLITIGTAGTGTANAGTAAASPVFPALPASVAALGVVRVPNGHTVTTTIPSNTIVDKRVIVPAALDAGATYENRIQHADPSKIAFYVRGVYDPLAYLKPIVQVDDYQNAPIFWVAPVGGIYVTDDSQTAYTVFGPYYFRADVYGFQWQNTVASYTFSGPPGNMLSWTDSVHEVYQSTRLPTVGSWGVVAACTLTTQDLGAPPTGSPTGYRSALKITNTTGGSAWISTPGSTSAYDGVAPNDRVAPVFWMRSSSAAAARTATVRIQWLTTAGATVGSAIDATVSIPNTGVWTKVSNTGQVAPATTGRVQISILIASANGEIHHVAGVGLMKNDLDGVFAPPFWGQEISGTGKVGGAALAGDRWVRTDKPTVPGAGGYACRVGGAPKAQVWDPIDNSRVIRLRADQSFTTTSLADLIGFSYPMVAGEQYQIDVRLIFTSAATTTGWQVGWTGPAATSFISICEYETSATAWAKDKIVAIGAHAATGAAYAAATRIMMRISAHYIPSAAGTLQFQMRTAVASSAILAARGSTLTIS